MALLRFDVPRSAEEGGGFEKRYWSITHTPVLGEDDEVSFVIQHPIDVTDLETLRQTVQAGDKDIRLDRTKAASSTVPRQCTWRTRPLLLKRSATRPLSPRSRMSAKNWCSCSNKLLR